MKNYQLIIFLLAFNFLIIPFIFSQESNSNLGDKGVYDELPNVSPSDF